MHAGVLRGLPSIPYPLMRASMSLLALGCACLAVVSMIKAISSRMLASRNASADACCWKDSIGRHPAKQKDAASFAMFRAGAVRIIILRKGVLMPLAGGSRAESAESGSAKHRCGSSWLPRRTEGATFSVAYRANLLHFWRVYGHAQHVLHRA